MGYQALLFCPDDKTARTVTQVLSELEFTVEACIEPFAAVKKLMGQHFDAVVVDCDNEQNATLLFKSARNSTSNQTSLAVAVVEGQAGVAKAFRIGANLVLTKPINIEQAKGTLRVARGLLRKSDPTKPGNPTATGSFAPPVPPATATTPAPVKPVAPKPVSTAKPAAPVAPRPAAQVSSLPPKPVQSPKPAGPSAWPAAAASTKPGPVLQNEPPEPVGEKSAAPPLYNAAMATPAPQKLSDPTPAETKPYVTSLPAASGAASAPAPARETVTSKVSERQAGDLFEKPAEPAHSEPAAYVGSAPSFSFGATTSESESSGGSKKAIIGIAAALLLAVSAYFAWSHFKGTSNSSAQPAATSPQPVTASTPVSRPVSTPAATKPSSGQPAPATTSPTTAAASQPEVNLSKSLSRSDEDTESVSSGSKGSRPSASAKSANASPAPPAPAKSVEAEKPESPALIVKGGKVAAQAKPAPAAEAPAPSLIGMGAPTTAALPNLGTADAGPKPTLQTLSVSQGVSQGLLYKKVAPSYPQNALRMHIEGKVELLATISKNGDITHIKVLSGDALLTKAASDAVKQWKYKPYLLNGEPVEIQTQVTVNFKLPH